MNADELRAEWRVIATRRAETAEAELQRVRAELRETLVREGRAVANMGKRAQEAEAENARLKEQVFRLQEDLRREAP